MPAAHSQQDTLLVAYPEVGDNNTELLILEGNKYGIIQSLKPLPGFGALVTDEAGVVLHHEIVTQVGGLDIQDCSFMFEDSSGYYFVGNCYIGGEEWFYAIKAQKDLSAFEITDTLKLAEQSFFYLNMMKFNKKKAVWEGFGDVEPLGNGGGYYINYLSLSVDFKFRDYIQIGNPPVKIRRRANMVTE